MCAYGCYLIVFALWGQVVKSNLIPLIKGTGNTTHPHTGTSHARACLHWQVPCLGLPCPCSMAPSCLAPVHGAQGSLWAYPQGTDQCAGGSPWRVTLPACVLVPVAPPPAQDPTKQWRFQDYAPTAITVSGVGVCPTCECGRVCHHRECGGGVTSLRVWRVSPLPLPCSFSSLAWQSRVSRVSKEVPGAGCCQAWDDMSALPLPMLLLLLLAAVGLILLQPLTDPPLLRAHLGDVPGGVPGVPCLPCPGQHNHE